MSALYARVREAWSPQGRRRRYLEAVGRAVERCVSR